MRDILEILQFYPQHFISYDVVVKGIVFLTSLMVGY